MEKVRCKVKLNALLHKCNVCNGLREQDYVLSGFENWWTKNSAYHYEKHDVQLQVIGSKARGTPRDDCTKRHGGTYGTNTI